MIYLALFAILYIQQLSAQCDIGSSSACDNQPFCEWSSTSECAGEGGEGFPACCLTITTTPTPATTTALPTCPILTGCTYGSEDCCDEQSACEWSSDSECEGEGGINEPDCCLTITTTTTTEEATTTTAEATTTTAEPTTTTAEFTTSTTASTTHTSRTSTTHTTSTTSTTPSTTSATSTTRTWPTPRPTLKSAMKWEMIHPAYIGNDGELLWHVYYGDFSDDERLDEFRKNEMWNIDEIRPIVESDNVFKRYHQDESEKFEKENAPVITGSSRSYGVWLLVISTILMVMFIGWCKYKPAKKTSSEYTPLLPKNDKVQYVN